MGVPRKLLALGDSGIYGWGDPEGGGWVERLRRHWMGRDEAPVLYNLGVRGDGLERLSHRLVDEFQVRGELRRQVPQGLLLGIGLNDTARVGRPDGRPQLEPEAFLYGFDRLLAQAVDLAPVFVVGMSPVHEQAMPVAGCLWYGNRDGDRYDRLLEEVCLSRQVPFLRLRGEPEEIWERRLCPDGLHCNSDGHRWIFDRVRAWPELLLWAGLPPEGACRLPQEDNRPQTMASR
ncbi:MAG: GDSL-type esterase/lipase family protein [Cyanobacteriota bacterium]